MFSEKPLLFQEAHLLINHHFTLALSCSDSDSYCSGLPAAVSVGTVPHKRPQYTQRVLLGIELSGDAGACETVSLSSLRCRYSSVTGQIFVDVCHCCSYCCIRVLLGSLLLSWLRATLF